MKSAVTPGVRLKARVLVNFARFITTVESVYLKSMGLICPREVLEPQHKCRMPPDSLLSCGIDRQFRGKRLSSVPSPLPHPSVRFPLSK